MKNLLVILFLFPVLSAFSQDWEKNYDFVDNCICGLSKVQKGGKIGYVNKDGIEVIKLQYEEGLTFHEGFTAVKSGHRWMYIDSTGKAITEPLYEDAGSFNNGITYVAKNNLYGFINNKGEVVIPFEFSNARGFSEGLAPASNSKGFWGFIDLKGNWVVKPIYDFTDNFENAEARVIKDSKTFYINRENKFVHD